MDLTKKDPRFHDDDDDEEEEDDAAGRWDDWDDEEEESMQCLCLFCNQRLDSADAVFKHCCKDHAFDFSSLRKSLALNFYETFKLINYLRSQVAENRCWSCGLVLESNKALLEHLHASNHSSNLMDSNGSKDGQVTWQDDKYLSPFLKDDPLLYSFEEEEEEEDIMEGINSIDVAEKEELIRELGGDDLINVKHLVESLSDDDLSDSAPNNFCTSESTSGAKDAQGNDRPNDRKVYGLNTDTNHCNGKATLEQNSKPFSVRKTKENKSRVTFANVAKKEIMNIDESYFGAYSRFGIHREMLSDQVRMDAYRGAILNNQSLFDQAVVMDVGCGTGILSLFAAQAGASKVVAVEASEKMASVARQIAKANNMLKEVHDSGKHESSSGVITVVEGMIEELDNRMPTEHHSVDVIVSEWMGYCLLYESMLSSVIYARDNWLKPGGAVLPDTAEMYVAGFGKGGTSLSFWENVYGFNMSCIGKEVVDDATKLPIIDVLESKDIVTETSSLHAFDLMTVKSEEMDFTTTFELKLKCQKENGSSGSQQAFLSEGYRETTASSDFKDLSLSSTVWCYGLVLWFETNFTSRFCKEMPTMLSTSPYKPKTHWSQTLLTFKEPIALSSCTAAKVNGSKQMLGTESVPASFIKGRISIARSYRHRSIDISVETMAVGAEDEIRVWPVQIFNI
ncbi:hypothetical protein SUGI_1085400 [Cryptomeria japonica]|nr:hypothetical protein SUGI_1085400 [Cryptomeria japonica]